MEFINFGVYYVIYFRYIRSNQYAEQKSQTKKYT